MFLKINKHLIPTNPKKVVSLDNKTWESQIPKRPLLRLYNEGKKKTPLATTRMSPFEDDLLFFAAMPPV
jgi:hypothetical protein